jgi:hypothetical protein
LLKYGFNVTLSVFSDKESLANGLERIASEAYDRSFLVGFGSAYDGTNQMLNSFLRDFPHVAANLLSVVNQQQWDKSGPERIVVMESQR